MNVSSRHYLEPLRQGTTIFQCLTVYAGAEGAKLFQQFSELIASDTFGNVFSRRSDDNGQNWTEPIAVYEPVCTAEGVWRRGESALFFDGERGRLIRFFNYTLYAGDRYDGTAKKHSRIFYEFSADGGQSFSAARQVIQHGYTAGHWMKDVHYGANSSAISFCLPVALPGGKIGLPCQMTPPAADPGQNPLLAHHQAGMLIGTWVGDDALEWEFGEYAGIAPTLSARGLCEPTIARLRDGRFLMICRGSNTSMPDVPGRKWECLSSDGGKSWSRPTPFAYDTGELFFSPATGSALIRHSRNGKLYWIGNVTPDNPNGNSPRYPLVIAEVNEARSALCQASLEVIDTKRESDSSLLQLSNFRVHEDRESGALVIIFARWFAKGRDYHCPATELRIHL